jgi:hypothetical protein
MLEMCTETKCFLSLCDLNKKWAMLSDVNIKFHDPSEVLELLHV